MKNLYPISDQFDKARDQAILDSKINQTDESDYLKDFLDGLDGTKEEKISKIGLIYKDIEAFEETIATEAKRLAAMKKRYSKELEDIKTYLKSMLDEDEKIKLAEVLISWSKSSGVALYCDPEDLPVEYQTIKVEPNKKFITESIKAGSAAVKKYAYLEERKNITIK